MKIDNTTIVDGDNSTDNSSDEKLLMLKKNHAEIPQKKHVIARETKCILVSGNRGHDKFTTKFVHLYSDLCFLIGSAENSVKICGDLTFT